MSVTDTNFRIDVPATVLARARRGEMSALEALYRLFERPAYTLALRLLGQPEAAREVMHDAMLRMLERIGQFRSDAPFWSWLRRILVNEALMKLRRERGLTCEPLPEADDTPGSSPAPWLLADTQALEAALARLPALTRSVLWLYHVEQYTHAEIAELTGKSASFSKSQVARGTQRLRELLTAGATAHAPTTAEVTPCLSATH